MCFGIRISSLLHLVTQIVSTHNLNCPKNPNSQLGRSWGQPEAWGRFAWPLHDQKGALWHARVGSYVHCEPGCPLWEVIFMQKSRLSKTLIVQFLHWPAIIKDDTASLGKAGIKFMSAHAFLAFLGQLGFWMGTIWVARWNRLEILIPKHMWKSKIRLLEQKLDENR